MAVSESKSTLMTLTSRGNQLEDRFESLQGEKSKLEPFLTEVLDWLRECVTFGQFLTNDSPDRRALQGRLNYWTSLLTHSGHATSEIDRLADFDPRAGFVLSANEFPYHGLIAATDKDRFFGREDEIQEYCKHLEEYSTLLIQSSSGGGKSSVAIAGVIPRLKDKYPTWICTTRITPGTNPVEALQRALTNAMPLSPEISQFEPSAILNALGNRILLIFVDQLEELLTLCSDKNLQQRFSEQLANLVKTEKVKLLATLRSDHSDRLEYSQACRALFLALKQDGGVKMLSSMSFKQIREAILKPAEAIGLRFIPLSLIDQLASETANAPGGLPLLQFSLQRLWDLRPKNNQGEPLDLINNEAFEKLPSVQQALGNVAAESYRNLSADVQDACKRLMLELTVLDERLEVPLRRRRREDDLLDVLNKAKLADNATARQLIEQFIQVRLLIRTGTGEARQIEVAHEALFRHWEGFQDWIKSEETRVRLQQVRQISHDAIQWDQKSRSPDYLKLTGDPLGKALIYRKENWLDALSDLYVVANADASTAKNAAATEAARVKNKYYFAKILVAFAAAVLSAVLLYNHFQSGWANENIKNSEKSADSTLAALIPRLEPVEALDLAYTIELASPGKFAAPLAYAIDRWVNSETLADNRDTGTDFTASGQAISLISRDSITKPLKVQLFPIKLNGTRWQDAVTIPMPSDSGLASLDVGPPIPGKPETRLVVMSFVKNDVFVKFDAYLIREGSPESRKIGTGEYPLRTSQVSDFSFDPSGTRAAIVAIQSHKQEKPTSRIFIVNIQNNLEGKTQDFSFNELVKDELSNSASDLKGTDRDPVTTVAFLTDAKADNKQKGPILITGSLDGGVFCNGTLANTSKESAAKQGAVTKLRSAGSAFVAVHISNSIEVGDCGKKEALVLKEDASALQSLSLRKLSVSPPKMHLSYTINSTLYCRSWKIGQVPDLKPEADQEHERCMEAEDFYIDQAFPIFQESGDQVIGFNVIPNRQYARIVQWPGGRLNSAAPAWVKTEGIPMARPPARYEKLENYPAASPNENYLVQVNVNPLESAPEGPRHSNVFRVKGEERSPLFKANQKEMQPVIAVAINNSGIAAVLNGLPDNKGSRLSLVDLKDNSKHLEVEVNDFQANCLKMSPNGTQILVSGIRGETRVFPTLLNESIGAETSSLPNGKPSKPSDNPSRGAGVSACALTNDGKPILGFHDGSVEIRHANEKDTPELLSDFEPFAIPSGALDVSVSSDNKSRFVAVLGKRSRASCLNGLPGYPIRIWDRYRKEGRDFPVASTCLLHNALIAIGPLELAKNGSDSIWVLPVYKSEENDVGEGLERFNYTCLACPIDDNDDPMSVSKRVIKEAVKFKPKIVSNLQSKYRITLGINKSR